MSEPSRPEAKRRARLLMLSYGLLLVSMVVNLASRLWPPWLPYGSTASFLLFLMVAVPVLLSAKKLYQDEGFRWLATVVVVLLVGGLLAAFQTFLFFNGASRALLWVVWFLCTAVLAVAIAMALWGLKKAVARPGSADAQ